MLILLSISKNNYPHKQWYLSNFMMYLWMMLATIFPAHSEPLEVYVEDAAAPWSNADGTGYANQIVTAAFSAENIPVHFNVVPYNRCKLMVLSGKAPACFSMSWEPAMKGKISFAEKPLYEIESTVFQHKGKAVASSPAELPSGSTIGVVLGYEYPVEITALQNRGIKFKNIDSEIMALKQLEQGLVDYVVLNINPVKNSRMLIKSANTPSAIFAFSGGKEGAFIGFSIKNPLGLKAKQWFDAGLAKISQNGTLKQFYAHWNLHGAIRN